VGKIERFEDIEAWKRARQLTGKIYVCTQAAAFGKDFGLKDQIRRAAVSSMSNIAEGFEHSCTWHPTRAISLQLNSMTFRQTHRPSAKWSPDLSTTYKNPRYSAASAGNQEDKTQTRINFEP
jgi:hypothetical protein